LFPLGDLNDTSGHLGSDAGLYSTVNDLFKFDQALYTEKLVKHQALKEAFMPGPLFIDDLERSGSQHRGDGPHVRRSSAAIE
jgi:hypothetical protein